MNEDRKKRGLANGKFFTAVAICALFLGSGNVMAAQTASNDSQGVQEQMQSISVTVTVVDTSSEIRKRASVNMPAVTLSGKNFSVNGVIINDPDRDLGNSEVVGDYEVSPILWEVRRERRIELVYEGIRFDDIRRWGKLHYADMKINKKLNLGAWLDKEAYLKEYNQANGTSYTIDDLKDILLDREGNSGYIKPIQVSSLLRTYGEKDYLYPIPTGQISLYNSKSEQLGDSSIKLEQNPGW